MRVNFLCILMKKIASIGIIALTVLLLISLSFAADAKLDIHFLSVGQGDAILLRTPIYGHNILIDGGPDDSALSQLGKILPYSGRQIDLIVLTHPHADHLIGAIKVLENYEVKSVLITGAFTKDSSYEYFLKLLRQKKIPIIIAKSSSDIKVGSIILDIIFPQENLSLQELSNSNNGSIAIRIKYNNQSILLTGDSEIEEEKEILIAGQTVQSNIYKAAHHGSKTGIYYPFLRSVNPQKVIIQSGAGNKFDHPHKEALKAFESLKSQILRNDISGTIDLSIH